jgi:plasmid stabilization system protein ParE
MAEKEREKHTVQMTQSAEDDLDEIIMFIANNSLHTAIKILVKIQVKIKTLDHSPNRGGYVPELLARNIRDYRQITEPPWRIIYKVNDGIVHIMTIIDSRRNLQDLLIHKFLR